MDELVTVIVPVYNVEKYLERCAESILSQSYRNLQIILIDDGSTDGSGDICDRYVARDSRVEVIHQANGGVSAARNAGLDRARGEWISFVDSDDYVSPYYIEDMRLAAGDDCDIAICRDVRVIGDNTDAVVFKRTESIQRISGYEASVRHFGEQAFLFNTCWGKIFRRSLWNEIRFPDIKISEDVFVAHSLLYRAGQIAVTDSKLYAYVISHGSLVRSKFSVQRISTVDAWQEGIRVFSKAGEADLTHIAKRVYCCRVFDAQGICKREIPYEREALRLLKQRAIEAYRDAKPIRGYVDCSWARAFAYRIKMMLGRWSLPLYNVLFIRGRVYI